MLVWFALGHYGHYGQSDTICALVWCYTISFGYTYSTKSLEFSVNDNTYSTPHPHAQLPGSTKLSHKSSARTLLTTP
jgi:hypothetical protein